MTLIKFHRVLIVTFILLCGVLAWVLWQRAELVDNLLWRIAALFFLALAVGFGFYLRTVGRKAPRP